MKQISKEDLHQTLQSKNHQLIDTRFADFFELGFIKQAINLSLKITKGKNIGNIISHEKPSILICKPGTELESIEHLKSFKINNIDGIISYDASIQESIRYDMVISISSEEAVLDSLHNPKAIVIDVRSEDNFKTGALSNAINIPISKLADKVSELQSNQETIIYCTSGNTSMLACSYLKSLGFTNVKNVWGGFEAIKKEPKAIIA